MYRSHRQEDFDAFNDHYGFEDEEYDDERPPTARDASVKWVRLLLLTGTFLRFDSHVQ